MDLVQLIIYTMSIGTIGSIFFILLAPIIWAIPNSHKKWGKHRGRVLSFFGEHATALCFAVVFLATSIGLYMSEIVGYEPCELCWVQRIFMYPQLIILGIALWKKTDVCDYVIGLSIPGAAVAAYQYITQVLIMIGTLPQSTTCSLTGPSCFTLDPITFGFVTIPLMSFVGFMVLIVLALSDKQHKKNNPAHTLMR